jgi:hypothetical protein
VYKNICLFIIGMVLFSMIILSCAQEESSEISQQEGIQTHIDYASLADEILEVEKKIMRNPAEKNLRLDLLAVSLDTTARVLRAVGIGEIGSGTQSHAIKLQFAERSALLDARRWLGYLLQWQENYESPDFGTINVDLPGHQIIMKDTTANNEIKMLVQTSIK